ncbi:jupiter microtubule associated homolog 2 isoform X1 [Scyliorhinus canicula]|uniref:jupiter microtubule associated homolog 2 isoform X1 n=1 Tax=Scyliorhinus canicula TaxID=7830 RepID=UPI0018F54CF8|nr:jupiter microtubule associated homolog 2 isoform X1 [Scyliorhinus canicula]
MSSTSTFQGLKDKPNSSRVLKPPGGGSSNIFGVPDVPSIKPHKMASNIFGPPEETSFPKRSNPPGGKSSGIFSESEPEPIPLQLPAVSVDTQNNDHSGEPVAPTVVRVNPNKPKDADIFSSEANEDLKEHEKQEREEKKDEEKPKEPTVDDHEPHLGPRPRSHNKVTQPPGGRSTFSLF